MNLYRQRKSIHFGPFLFRSPPRSKKGGRREEEAIVLRLPFRGNNFSTLSFASSFIAKSQEIYFSEQSKTSMRVVPAEDVKQWFDHTRWRDWELRVRE